MSESILQKELTLSELLDLPSFNEVCKSFVDLYRVGVKVFDTQGNKLVDIKIGSGDFCAYMFTKGPGRTQCTETVTYIKQHPLDSKAGPDGIQVRDCFTGARYVLMPVLHEGGVVGRVIFGPFVPDDLKDLGAPLVQLGGTFDLDRSRQLMGKIRKAPEATIRKVLDHFTKIVDVLVFTSYKSALTTQLHIESITESFRELQEKSKQLRESYDRLKELDRLKSNFLATVSHELRTPLTSVIGYSEMLLAGLAGDLNGEQREYLQTILEKGESLLNLITSILDLSKIEARGVKLAPQQTDIEKTVKSSVTTLVPTATKKQVQIVSHVEPNLPGVLVDGDKLRQCVVNLLSNAVKFTPAGGTITVHAGLVKTPPDGAGPFGRAGWFEVAVTDTGVGIASDQLDRIFDTFYQVDSSSTREYGGAGLGLAIVKSYVEAHGGRVRVTSDPGKGSTFTLVFPVDTGAPLSAPIPVDPRNAGGPSATASPFSPFGRA